MHDELTLSVNQSSLSVSTSSFVTVGISVYVCLTKAIGYTNIECRNLWGTLALSSKTPLSENLQLKYASSGESYVTLKLAFGLLQENFSGGSHLGLARSVLRDNLVSSSPQGYRGKESVPQRPTRSKTFR